MITSILLLLSLIATPVATPMAFETEPDWILPIASSGSGEVVIADDLAIVASTDRQVRGIELDTGEVQWQIALPYGATDTIGLDGETLLIPAERGTLYLVSAVDGTVLDTLVISSSELRTPLIAENTIVVADSSGSVYFLDRETMTTRDVEVTSGPVSDQGLLWEAGNLAIFATPDGTLWAFDIDSGRLSWQSVLPGVPGKMMLLGESSVVLGVGGGMLMRLSAKDGAAEWQIVFPSGGLDDIVPSGDSVLTTTSNGMVMSLDAETGDANWAEVIPAPALFAEETCDTRCLLLVSDGTIAEVHPEEESWSAYTVTPGSPGGEHVATDDQLIVVFDNGDVVSWKLAGD